VVKRSGTMRDDEAWWKRPVGDPKRGLFVHLVATSEPVCVVIRRRTESVVQIDLDEVEPLCQVLAEAAADLAPWAGELPAYEESFPSGWVNASPRLIHHDELCPVCNARKLWESPDKPGFIWCRGCGHTFYAKR